MEIDKGESKERQCRCGRRWARPDQGEASTVRTNDKEVQGEIGTEAFKKKKKGE